MKRIGVIGLGIMGMGITKNFLKHGYEVYVWNRSKEKGEEIEHLGGISCTTPGMVASKADLVFEVTANDESSRSVWLGRNGILDGAGGKTVLVTSATLSIAWLDELVEHCKRKRRVFVDIPLTGGRVGAESGTLTLLCGGSKRVLSNIRPQLEVIATKIYYFGPAGQGMRYKLILNFLQATHIVAFGQAMKIAAASDMNLERVAEALVDRPGGAITQIAKNAYFRDPDPVTFSVEWITKDLTYAKAFASTVAVPILDEVLAAYERAVSTGLKNEDWASITTKL